MKGVSSLGPSYALRGLLLSCFHMYYATWAGDVLCLHLVQVALLVAAHRDSQRRYRGSLVFTAMLLHLPVMLIHALATE